VIDPLTRLVAALADRYRIERELGQGGMATELVAKATARLMSLKRHVPKFRLHHFGRCGWPVHPGIASVG